MTDRFPAECRAFVNQFDRLRLPGRKSFGDLPDHADVRPLISTAEFIWMQDRNPLRDFTLSETLVIDLAAAVLRWMRDPGNPARWDAMLAARAQLDDEYPWLFDPDDDAA